ncbi:hypothetical protein TSH58p_22175 (plasmid) [Azospirillum sp. TSH58]|uniref:hypothetical protein n=1 Tax=Azospirillum sp. TSH58 TaxID=664962 RepID=UPI000D602502|nr:hypothetical protein [Azospirillum sp. TSH58]AWJ86236.1 hypothetical protein TSH58p_22175 [Azospirillum sp. TSH58]PWC71743.1 hypothetical protein TSH58_10990 [Azospirillum sp. TSH58]
MIKGMDAPGVPAGFEAALDLVRSLWADGRHKGVPERLVAWAMMVESVDRLAALHGPQATAGLLDRLSQAVLDTPPGTGRAPLQ